MGDDALRWHRSPGDYVVEFSGNADPETSRPRGALETGCIRPPLETRIGNDNGSRRTRCHCHILAADC